jgi:molybdate transport system regulatory protein
VPTSRIPKSSFKIWLELDGKPVLGKGGAEILKQLAREQSISRAAERLDMSYRYVWNYLKQIERAVGKPIIQTYRGGKRGGGGAKLTGLARRLLEDYERVEKYVGEILEDAEYWEVIGLKISARNRWKGKVISVEKDGITAKVKVQINVPATVTALISREAVDDLNIKVGDEVEAVVKATEVMIAK